MRISPRQIATIIDTTRRIVGADAQVWLFGSRLDDARKGGDIDLLIESTPGAGIMDRARIKNRLEQQLQVPVDVVATSPGTTDNAFVAIARARAVRLRS